MATEHKTVSHRIPDELLQAIDRARGHMNRNTWMNMILARAIDGKLFKVTNTPEKFVVEVTLRKADHD